MTLINLQGQAVDPYAPLGFCAQCGAAAWAVTQAGLLCPSHEAVLIEMEEASHETTVRTPDEIRDLCWNWRNDPCWDLETTEGFEAHAPELLEYRLEWERKWAADKYAIVGEKALELGVPENRKLAEYVMTLERRIRTLEARAYD